MRDQYSDVNVSHNNVGLPCFSFSYSVKKRTSTNVLLCSRHHTARKTRSCSKVNTLKCEKLNLQTLPQWAPLQTRVTGIKATSHSQIRNTAEVICSVIKTKALIYAFLLLQYFLFVLRHTHSCCYLIWKSLLEVLLQQPPLKAIFIYNLGWNPWATKHSKAENAKGANGRGTHLPENVIFPCFWSFLQHRMVNAPDCFKKLLTSQTDKTSSFSRGSLHPAFALLDVTYCHAELLARK